MESVRRLISKYPIPYQSLDAVCTNGSFAPQAVIPYPRNMRIEPPYYSHHDALGEAYRFVGNNSLEAPLNASTHGEHSSASTENSDGIDPDYCCRSAVVRWRRILGPASRSLVKLTMIDFPNHSRFYDVTRHAVRFWGYDSAIEASFFIDEDALAQIQPGVRPDESGFLNAFDATAGGLTIWARPTFETVGLNPPRRDLPQSRPSAICRRRSHRRRRCKDARRHLRLGR